MRKRIVRTKTHRKVEPTATQAERSVEESVAVVVQHTLQAAAMALSRVLGRPEDEILNALGTELRAVAAAGLDFATALNHAKSNVIASVRSGIPSDPIQ